MFLLDKFVRGLEENEMAHKEIVIVVSVSIFKDDEVLIIKENKPTALNKWNFPSGRVEYGEDILNAALREVKEETGYVVKLISTTGVYNFNSSTDNQVLLFHFTAEVTGGSLNLEEDEIIDSKWIKLNEIVDIEDRDLREVGVVRQIINNLLKGNFHPISIFNDQLST
jgi:8-oxo-dGTP diphosphatase